MIHDQFQSKRACTKVENMAPADIPKSKDNKGSSVADNISASDKAWFESNLLKVKEALTFTPEDEGDSKFKAALTEKSREVTKLLSVVRTRKRSVRRRTNGSAAEAIANADDLEAKLSLMSDLLRLLQRPLTSDCVGDELYSKINPLRDSYGTFSTAVYKAIARHMFQADLSWKRWESMRHTTFVFLERVCSDSGLDCGSFMVQNMNLSLQKLLKGIAVDKVTKLQRHLQMLSVCGSIFKRQVGS